jgi:hypothetical protein
LKKVQIWEKKVQKKLDRNKHEEPKNPRKQRETSKKNEPQKAGQNNRKTMETRLL